MKLLGKITLILGLFLGQVFAATGTNGVDENGRLWGSAYFDIHSGVQSPVLGAIKYTNRGGFDWNGLYSNLQNFGANEITYKVSGRIVVPDTITTDQIYITFGKNVSFWERVFYGSIDSEGATEAMKSETRTILKFLTKVDKTELAVADYILGTVKIDEFGTKYVDFAIDFYINLASGEIAKAKNNIFKIVEQNYSKKINSIRIKIAPKARSFESQWQDAKIYVID